MTSPTNDLAQLDQAAAQARSIRRDPAQMLRIAALFAAPVLDPHHPDRSPAPLNLRAEWERLVRAVSAAHAPILLARLTPPTLATLRRELSPRVANQGLFPHVLHISGHAWAQGLILEDDYGQTHAVTAADLLAMIRPPQPLDLVVLNACETAAETQSAAQALLNTGLARAVVGHPQRVRDDEAIAFARMLYTDLTDGYPLREAMARAQRTITTHTVVMLGDGDLCFGKLERGEALIHDARPFGNLPAETGIGFVGRGVELVTLARQLDQPPKVIVISGPAGIGKSRLSLEAAHRNAWRFPGGVAYAEARGTTCAIDLLLLLADALRLPRLTDGSAVPPDGAKASTLPLHRRVVDALLGHARTYATLFVLDNLETLPLNELAIISDFVGRLGGPSAAIIALRSVPEALEELPHSWALSLYEGLREDDAVHYASEIARSKGVPLTGSDAEEIACATAGHPLLITQIVTRARRRDRQALLAEVRSRAGDFAAQVEAVYAWSAERVGAAGERAWSALPLFPAGWVPEAALRTLAGDDGIEALRSAAIADFDPMRQVWRWHPTAAGYAAQRWPLRDAERKQRHAATLPAWSDWLAGLGEDTQSDALLEAALLNLAPLIDAARDADAGLRFLHQLARVLPAPDHTLTLRSIQEPLYRTMADLAPDTVQRAQALSMLGYARSAVGRYAEALAATAEAVDLLRNLTAAQPDAFRPDLARSLSNLGAHLAAVGRYADALAATEEAVDLLRNLAAAQPDAFRPALATSLSNLGKHLAAVGRDAEALAATAEAVDLYRNLAAAQPDAFRPTLARSLANLGAHLAAVRRYADALAATAEAVDLYRNLTAAQPDAFRPPLAASLSNLGNRLAAVGRDAEALAATAEAVDLYRNLTAAQPDAFRPKLAISLNLLGDRLTALNRIEEALPAYEEALHTLLPFYLAQPTAFAKAIDDMVRNYVAACQKQGCEPDAGLLAQVTGV